MLQPVREFGLECLRDAGEETGVRDDHAQWAAWLAEQAEVELVGPGQQAWFDGIERELDNVRAALTWTIFSGDAETSLRIAGSLNRFWASRGCITEAREWLGRSLGLAGCDPSIPRGNALTGLGVMAYFLGDRREAELRTRAAAIQYERAGHQLGVAYTYGNLGMIADADGESQEAIRLYTQALDLFRTLGDRTCTGYMLNNLGLVALDLGDLAGATSYLEEALALHRELRNADSVGYELSSLGSVALAAGDVERSAELHREALEIRQSLGSIIGIGIELDAIAQIATEWEEFETAAALFGAAASLRLEYDISPTPMTHAKSETCTAQVREAVGPDAFSLAWEQGLALSTDDAVNLALSVVDASQFAGRARQRRR
jgi:tetratricopeptide (TPR) repeat protein